MAHKSRQIWHPADYDIKDIRAIQALADGNASDEQQKRALDWIINKAAGTYEDPIIADDPHGRIGAFMNGRASVGRQIIKLMKLKADLFRKEGETD